MRSLAAVVAFALVASAVTVGAVTAAVNTTTAAQATAGVPASPTALITENFQESNVNRITDLSAYTEAAYWAGVNNNGVPTGNGLVAGRDSTLTPSVANAIHILSGSDNLGVQNMFLGAAGWRAYAIGLLDGNQSTNHAVSNQTQLTGTQTAADVGYVPGELVVASANQTPLSSNSRFLTVGIDLSATGCAAADAANAPLDIRMYLKDSNGAEIPVSVPGYNVSPCNQGQYVSVPASADELKLMSLDNKVYYQRFAGTQATLWNSPTIGFAIRNYTASVVNNDFAYDNIKILDVTPQLEKAFSPTSVATGGTSTLTYTVTNTSELGQKNGWAFTDTLPAGLTATGTTGGTCSATTSASGSTVAVANGNLPAGQTSCTVSVGVTANPTVTTTYTNAASNISGLVGMNNITTPASVTFVANPKMQVTKTATSAVNAQGAPIALTDVGPGAKINYTVTGTNIGDGDGTASNPAILTDDLTGVIDDATYNNDASATSPSGSGTTTYSSPKITWSGPLKIGQTVTETYSVTVKGWASSGDRKIVNTAYDGNGTTPSPCPAGTPTCATVEVDLPALTIAKSTSVTEVPSDGSTIAYTVKVTNPGPGAYTANHLATFSDDLSAVLDDATYNGDVSATTGGASVSGKTLSWSGTLAAGATATITYSVTYHANQGGDHKITNLACVPTTEAADTASACASVSVPAAAYEYWKTVSPDNGTSVAVGDTVTYTLHYTNTGQAAATVNSTDDLTGLLDDATITSGPTASSSNLTPSISGNTLTVTGTLPIGATYTVT